MQPDGRGQPQRHGRPARPPPAAHRPRVGARPSGQLADARATPLAGHAELRRPTASLAGTGPCNSYFGPFTIEGDATIEVGELGSTRRACAPAVMAAEDEYLTALGSVSTVDATDRDRLVLRTARRRGSPTGALDVADELIGDVGRREPARSGDAIVSVLPGTEPVVTFDDDGTLSANGGCNTLIERLVAGRQRPARSIRPPRPGCSAASPTGSWTRRRRSAPLSTATAEVQIAGDTDQAPRRGRLDRAHRHPQGRRRS